MCEHWTTCPESLHLVEQLQAKSPISWSRIRHPLFLPTKNWFCLIRNLLVLLCCCDWLCRISELLFNFYFVIIDSLLPLLFWKLFLLLFSSNGFCSDYLVLLSITTLSLSKWNKVVQGKMRVLYELISCSAAVWWCVAIRKLIQS